MEIQDVHFWHSGSYSQRRAWRADTGTPSTSCPDTQSLGRQLCSDTGRTGGSGRPCCGENQRTQQNVSLTSVFVPRAWSSPAACLAFFSATTWGGGRGKCVHAVSHSEGAARLVHRQSREVYVQVDVMRLCTNTDFPPRMCDICHSSPSRW